MKKFLFYIHSLSIYTKLAVIILFMILFITASTVLVALDISKNQTNQLIQELIQSSIQTNEDYVSSAILANDAWSLYKFLKALTKANVITQAGILDTNNKIIAHTDTNRFHIGDTYINDHKDEELSFISNGLKMGTIVLHVEKQSINSMIKQTFVIDFIFLLIATFLSFVVANVFINRLLKRFDVVMHNTKAISQRRWDLMKYDTCKENDEITELIKNSFVFMKDIKKSIKVENDLKDFYHDILNTVDSLIVICNPKLQIEYQNNHTLSNYVLHPAKKLFIASIYDTLKPSTQDEQSFSITDESKALTILVSKKYIGQRIVFSFSDITLLTLEEENKKVMHSLEVLGEISSIFAHEIKNLLQPLKLLLPKNRLPDSEDIPIIHSTFTKVGKQVTDFLQLGKPIQVIQDEPQSVKKIYLDIEETLESCLVNKNLTLKHNIDEKMSLHVNKDSIELILMNLLTNAIEAAFENTTINVDWVYTKHNMTLLKVQNEGPTIPKNIQENIFKPFFTTKKEGSGLGLFSIYKIVHTAQGRAEIISQKNFTTFEIYMPNKGTT